MARNSYSKSARDRLWLPYLMRMGDVIPFPRRSDWEPELSKRQLADVLGYTTRWVELRVSEGMPSKQLPNGYRRFRRSEAEAWLAQRRTG